MDVIVKGSPSIEIGFERKVVNFYKAVADTALSETSENPVMNKVITEELNNKVDKVEGKGLSTNDYTDNDKARVLLGGLHIGNDTQEHRANLALAAAQGACYGPITVEPFYGTYIRVGEYHGVYYVDAIVNFSSPFFPPDIVRYRVDVSSGVWSMEYMVDISTLFDKTSIASRSEINALFDDGTNNGSSTSY